MSLPKIYTNETAARKHLEKLQWPDGPFCPHCGNADPGRIKADHAPERRHGDRQHHGGNR